MSEIYHDQFVPGLPEWKKKQLQDAEQAALEDSPTSPHLDSSLSTHSTPAALEPAQSEPKVASGEHIHEWVESDESHPDGHLTAFCAACSSGITYYPDVHRVKDGTLTNQE